MLTPDPGARSGRAGRGPGEALTPEARESQREEGAPAKLTSCAWAEVRPPAENLVSRPGFSIKQIYLLKTSLTFENTQPPTTTEVQGWNLAPWWLERVHGCEWSKQPRLGADHHASGPPREGRRGVEG